MIYICFYRKNMFILQTFRLQETANMIDIKDGMNCFERGVKRLFDIVASFLGLIVLSPVFFVLCFLLWIRRDGSVFFKQERIGFKGKPFYILKFRTMPEHHSIKEQPQLMGTNREIQSSVCRFLREHHLDELPQLWNVLVGDMSFVGPRPERKFFIDQIMAANPDYEYIYQMRPGLTSWATLYNGYTDTLEKMLTRLQMDLDYYAHRSLWVDLKIILTTTLFIVNGKKF